jgi:hypothetical protein
MSRIVAFCGFIGAGKTSAANALVEMGYEKISFADPLKDAVSAVFGWDRKRLSGLNPTDRAWREEPDTFWTEALGKPVTPRWALQYVGTEVFRNTLSHDVWAIALEARMNARPDAKFVIDDCRFSNEQFTIKQCGGTLVWIDRNRPEWWTPDFEVSEDASNHESATRRKAVIEAQVAAGVHPSELDWLVDGPYLFDAVIKNAVGLDDLQAQVRALVAEPKRKKTSQS